MNTYTCVSIFGTAVQKLFAKKTTCDYKSNYFIYFCDVTMITVKNINNADDWTITIMNYDDVDDCDGDSNNDDGNNMTVISSAITNSVKLMRQFLIHTVSTVTGSFLIHKCFHGNRDLGSLIESLYHLGNRAKGGARLIVFLFFFVFFCLLFYLM